MQSPGLLAKKTVKVRRVSYCGAQYDACELWSVQGIYFYVFTLLGLGLNCMDYQSRLFRVIESHAAKCQCKSASYRHSGCDLGAFGFRSFYWLC